ncbi:MAG: TonB-dependent receptor domain-containing protein [Caulobacterales bacterium]
MTGSFKARLVRGAALGVLLIAAGLCAPALALAADPSAAQSAGTTPPPPAAAPAAIKTPVSDTETAQAGELVVTGSHLKHTTFTSQAPVQIITTEESKLEGVIDPAEILQRNPIAAGSVQINNQFGGFVVNGGPGVDTISLRGLGAQRTLVLLNGRRLNPAGVSGTVAAVDLNIIPDALVDRYEILKDGASSVYGSDAIGGVVNIITRDKFDGLTLETDDAIPTRGAGSTYEVAISGGRVADNYHILGSFQYFNQGAIRIGDLPGGKCPLELQRAPGQTSFNYGRVNLDGSPYCAFTQTNDVEDFSFGALFVYDPTQGPTFPYSFFQQDPFPTIPRHTNIATDPREQQVDALSPVQRYGFTLLGGVDLPHNMEFYFEDLITNRQSQQNAYLPQVFPSTFNQLVEVSLNPFNPFTNDSNPQDNDFVQPVLTAPVQRFTEDVTAGRALFGLRGDFGSFLPGWTWDTSAIYGFSRASYVSHPRLSSRFDNALTVVLAPSGTPANQVRQSPVDGMNYTCAINLINPAENCYPLNMFESSAAFASDPALAYITAIDHGRTDYDQVVVDGSANGPLFKLPAGPVQGVFGFEVRYDQLYDNPGAHAVANDYLGQSTAGVTQGNETVGEAYVEVEAPLVRGVPLIEDLTLNLTARYTNYRTAGSSATYKVGFNWQILPSIRFRGTYGTSFRGPALYENYLAAQTSFTGALDPCQNYGANAAPGSNLFKNCASEGLPPNFPGYSSTPEVFTQGALGRLKPETSKNITVGVVWQPEFADLQASVDYFHIEVDNEIATIGSDNILNLCYDSSQFRSGSAYCTLISPRDANNNINLINDSYINIAVQVVSGVDFNLRYRRKFSFGELGFDAEATYNIEDNQELIPGTGFTNFVGTFGEPHLNGDAQVQFKHGDWLVLWSTNYLGPQNEAGLTGDSTVRYKELQQEQFYHSISLTYEADKWKATLGVRDIFDTYPPVISNNPSAGFAPRVGEFANGYGNLTLFGRTVFVRLSKSF